MDLEPPEPVPHLWLNGGNGNAVVTNASLSVVKA